MAFREGFATSLDVVDAELSLSAIRMERLRSAYLFDVSLAEFLETCGQADRFEAYRLAAVAVGEVEGGMTLILVGLLVLMVAGWFIYKPTPRYLQVEIEATEADLSAKISGQVASLAVREGETVRKGQLPAVFLGGFSWPAEVIPEWLRLLSLKGLCGGVPRTLVFPIPMDGAIPRTAPYFYRFLFIMKYTPLL